MNIKYFDYILKESNKVDITKYLAREDYYSLQEKINWKKGLVGAAMGLGLATSVFAGGNGKAAVSDDIIAKLQKDGISQQTIERIATGRPQSFAEWLIVENNSFMGHEISIDGNTDDFVRNELVGRLGLSTKNLKNTILDNESPKPLSNTNSDAYKLLKGFMDYGEAEANEYSCDDATTSNGDKVMMIRYDGDFYGSGMYSSRQHTNYKKVISNIKDWASKNHYGVCVNNTGFIALVPMTATF